MKDKGLALIAPYFGKLPAHFQLWLNSCAMNPKVTWFLYTDDRTQWEYPNNVKVNYCTLSDLKGKFENRLGFRISLNDTHKLGDYKPLFGFLFEKELEPYKAWGHIDVSDVIYGNFNQFSIMSRIQEFERLGCVGHLTIYRNTPEINKRFMTMDHSGLDYHKIFSSPNFMNFEETAPGSIGQIWRNNNWLTGSLDDCVADIYSLSYPFRISTARPVGGVQQKNRDLIFEWNKGTLLGHEISPFGGVLTREFLYVHFKRRHMKMCENLDSSHFIIAPDGFYPVPNHIDEEYLMKICKNKFPDPVWVSNKWRNLKCRLQHAR